MTLRCVYTGLFMLNEMALNFRFILFPLCSSSSPSHIQDATMDNSSEFKNLIPIIMILITEPILITVCVACDLLVYYNLILCGTVFSLMRSKSLMHIFGLQFRGGGSHLPIRLYNTYILCTTAIRCGVVVTLVPHMLHELYKYNANWAFAKRRALGFTTRNVQRNRKPKLCARIWKFCTRFVCVFACS